MNFLIFIFFFIIMKHCQLLIISFILIFVAFYCKLTQNHQFMVVSKTKWNVGRKNEKCLKSRKKIRVKKWMTYLFFVFPNLNVSNFMLILLVVGSFIIPFIIKKLDICKFFLRNITFFFLENILKNKRKQTN